MKYFSIGLQKIVRANTQQDAVALATGKRVAGAEVLTTWTEAERISATEAQEYVEEAV